MLHNIIVISSYVIISFNWYHHVACTLGEWTIVSIILFIHMEEEAPQHVRLTLGTFIS